jgi:hypothetical protein
MGYIAHDAVLVTLSDYVQDRHAEPSMPDVDAFRASLPEEWRPLVVGPIKALINGYISYAFLPDGSKEGWPPSDAGDEYRDQFAALFSFTYEDGSSPFDVVRVRFGGDDWETPSVSILPDRRRGEGDGDE